MYENNLKADILKADDICIAAHVNPDGDAMGSALAMALAVRELGKNPRVIVSGWSENMSVLYGMDMIYTGSIDELSPQLLIILDCSTAARLSCGEELLKRARLSYCLDHHISNESFASFNIVNPSASSACEVVYECIKDFIRLNREIATDLYAGILTDTGGFRHSSTSRRTHEILGTLIEYGVDTAFLHYRLLRSHSLTEARLLAKAIDNLTFTDGLTLSTLSSAQIKECGADTSQLGGIIDYLLDVNDTMVALFATEREGGIVKLSFRSRSVDVNAVASEFGGGGHILAAGASVSGELKAITQRAAEAALKAIENYKSNIRE